MIKKLRKKFIVVATVSTVVLMSVLILIMNLVNFSSVVNESDTVLEVLNRSNMHTGNSQEPPDLPKKSLENIIPGDMSPEVPYESRYFTATVDTDGNIKDTNVSQIVSVDETDAEDFIKQAVEKSSTNGFIDQFRFSKETDGENTKLIFLDCGRNLDSFRSFMWTSISIGILGCVIAFVVFLLASERIIRPMAESYEKQKRFITDAGHEIKTPLTVIGANVDLLELDVGENESIDEIRMQTKRLAGLTNDLVYLSKMEESGSAPKTEYSLSETVSDKAGEFRAVALAKNKNYTVNVQQNVTVKGLPDEMRKLVSILLDNAMKYSPENGIVSLDLYTQKKSVVLIVKNTTAEEVKRENLNSVFDRFYRMDASRNSQTGGHGIGLSIARAIAEAAGGKIAASTETEHDFCVTVTLPI